jgi:ABC-type xylose transport system permease subunit
MSAFIERITGGQVGGTTERSIRLSLSFIRLGPVIILLLLVLAMTLLSPVFLTGANISNVIVQTSVLAVLAIGQLFVILVAGIDLSVGSVLGLSTATKAANGESIDPRVNTGLTHVTKKNAPKYLKIRERQLGALLGVED